MIDSEICTSGSSLPVVVSEDILLAYRLAWCLVPLLNGFRLAVLFFELALEVICNQPHAWGRWGCPSFLPHAFSVQSIGETDPQGAEQIASSL